jgi:hypothetical protein
MKKWIIVGGGIQGCTLATYLLKKKLVTTDELVMIDPCDVPLSNWLNCTKRIQMPFLRSPSVHHIDVDPFSLERFAKSNGWSRKHFLGMYDRPSLQLFNDHTKKILNEIQIEKSWLKGKVVSLERADDNWSVVLDSGEALFSEKVALAMGVSEHLNWSDWAMKVKEQKGNIQHIFSNDGSDSEKLSPPFLIVGGGISSAHLALKLSSNYPGEVTLLSRHDLEVHQFDSDPGWQGPKNMTAFLQIKDYRERRFEIVKARHRGSMTNELFLKLKKAEQRGRLQIIKDNVTNAELHRDSIRVDLAECSSSLTSSSILLTTGFCGTPPGLKWLTKTIENEQLKYAECGFPIISPDSLEWSTNLYVLGAIAELELGPTARNIAGARRAAERITQFQTLQNGSASY